MTPTPHPPSRSRDTLFHRGLLSRALADLEAAQRLLAAVEEHFGEALYALRAFDEERPGHVDVLREILDVQRRRCHAAALYVPTAVASVIEAREDLDSQR